jgi:subtilisin family serine protease
MYSRRQLKEPIAGVAPKTKLLSLRVLNSSGTGKVSNLLAAIGYVQEMNDHGRLLRVHGMNMSVGYGFDPEWFGCGQSPLCVEVDRLVRSGVSVVVAAGNTGYWKRGGTEAAINSGLDLTINDPGNAQLAITVGSTHRDRPHTYGVSYFSSKGPTGDGRLKPDLVAPGEKVLSCAAGDGVDEIQKHLTGSHEGERVDYRQESGTSMAAPHVSGAVAAFLSARNEFIGHPQRVKKIFTESATDLGRDKYFQGHGLLDLMRAMQSV